MATERPAKAKRILVVEDEPMIRMLLEDTLGEATKNADFDLAILDADLNGQPPPCRLPKPSLPAARPSSLPRAMARCPSPIGAGRC